MLQALAEKKIGRRDQANNWIWRCANMTREVHEEYAVQRWPETKRLLGLLVNSSGGAHARNARRLVHAARQQDRRLSAALLAAAIPHTAEAGEVVNGARTRMSRKPAALARELLRNFPKGKGRRGTRRRKKKGVAEGVAPEAALALDGDAPTTACSTAIESGEAVDGRRRPRRRPAPQGGGPDAARRRAAAEAAAEAEAPRRAEAGPRRRAASRSRPRARRRRCSRPRRRSRPPRPARREARARRRPATAPKAAKPAVGARRSRPAEPEPVARRGRGGRGRAERAETKPARRRTTGEAAAATAGRRGAEAGDAAAHDAKARGEERRESAEARRSPSAVEAAADGAGGEEAGRGAGRDARRRPRTRDDAPKPRDAAAHDEAGGGGRRRSAEAAKPRCPPAPTQAAAKRPDRRAAGCDRTEAGRRGAARAVEAKPTRGRRHGRGAAKPPSAG